MKDLGPKKCQLCEKKKYEKTPVEMIILRNNPN